MTPSRGSACNTSESANPGGSVIDILVWDLGLRIQGLGCRVYGWGIQGFRVPGVGEFRG